MFIPSSLRLQGAAYMPCCRLTHQLQRCGTCPPMQMKQLNDPIFIISFGGDKSASAANSMMDTQTRYYSGVGIGNTTGRPSGNARGTGFGGDKSLSKAFCTWNEIGDVHRQPRCPPAIVNCTRARLNTDMHESYAGQS